MPKDDISALLPLGIALGSEGELFLGVPKVRIGNTLHSVTDGRGFVSSYTLSKKIPSCL